MTRPVGARCASSERTPSPRERPLDPLVSGPEHLLLAKQVASDLRALVSASSDLAELVTSWQYLAGMCGLFDELDESERPDPDWRMRIEQALALIEEATA